MEQQSTAASLQNGPDPLANVRQSIQESNERAMQALRAVQAHKTNQQNRPDPFAHLPDRIRKYIQQSQVQAHTTRNGRKHSKRQQFFTAGPSDPRTTTHVERKVKAEPTPSKHRLCLPDVIAIDPKGNAVLPGAVLPCADLVLYKGKSLTLGWKPEKGPAEKLIDAVRTGQPLPRKKFKEKPLPDIPTKGNPAQKSSFKAVKSLARHVGGRVNSSARTKGFYCMIAKSGLAFNAQDDEAELAEQTGMLRRHVGWCGRMYRKVVKHGDPGLMLPGFVKLVKHAGMKDRQVAKQAFKIF